MVVQFYDKHAKRQAGIHAAELGSPQRTARHSGWASAKKAESYYTKLSGPKVCQTHRSGRVMLILCKGWTFCSSFALWHQNIIHRVNSRKWTQTYKCNLSEEREIVLSLTCKSQRAGIPWRHEKVGKKAPILCCLSLSRHDRFTSTEEAADKHTHSVPDSVCRSLIERQNGNR